MGDIQGPYSEDSVELFQYIQKNTKEDSIVLFFKPRVMTLYTGRYSARTLDSTQIEKSGAEYITCQQNSICDAHINQFWPGIKKIFMNGHFILYQFENLQ